MGITGTEIRKIRTTFGWSIDHFAHLLGVHPVTLNRWELARDAQPKIDGIPLSILLGLKSRVITGPPAARLDDDTAKRAAADIDNTLVVGGVLLALGVLLAFINKR